MPPVALLSTDPHVARLMFQETGKLFKRSGQLQRCYRPKIKLPFLFKTPSACPPRLYQGCREEGVLCMRLGQHMQLSEAAEWEISLWNASLLNKNSFQVENLAWGAALTRPSPPTKLKRGIFFKKKHRRAFLFYIQPNKHMVLCHNSGLQALSLAPDTEGQLRFSNSRDGQHGTLKTTVLI